MKNTKKLTTFLLIASITIAMFATSLVNVSAATTDKIYFQYPTDKGSVYINTEDNSFLNKNHTSITIPNTWTYTDDGADYITLSFDEATYVQEDYDRIIVFDKDNSIYNIYTGHELTGKTICVPGDTVTVRIVSNKIISNTQEDTNYNVTISTVVPLRIGILDIDDEDSITNLTQIQRYLVGQETLTDIQVKLADIDGDGQVTVSDATMLQRSFAEMII